MDRLNINNEMAQLDDKNRGFYDELTDEERKKFSLYLMLRWSSSVQGGSELQEYYVQSCNHYLNKNFFAVNRHPKLQWLMSTAVSPGLGRHRHQWIAAKKKDSGNSAIKRQLMEIYPTMKMDEIELLAQQVTQKELTQWNKDNGND